MSEQRCPTCGSVVKVAGDPSEGTMHYEAVSDVRLSLSLAREQRLREALERVHELVDRYYHPPGLFTQMEVRRGEIFKITEEALSSVPDGEGE